MSDILTNVFADEEFIKRMRLSAEDAETVRNMRKMIEAKAAEAKANAPRLSEEQIAKQAQAASPHNARNARRLANKIRKQNTASPSHGREVRGPGEGS